MKKIISLLLSKVLLNLSKKPTSHYKESIEHMQEIQRVILYLNDIQIPNEKRSNEAKAQDESVS